MKTIHSFKIIIAALTLGALMPVQHVRAGFELDGFDGNEAFTAVDWLDNAAGREVWWVLNNTKPFYTVDFSGVGDWTSTALVSHNGVLWIFWFRFSGSAVDVAFWRIVNGALTSAATYTTSGWFIGINGLAGQKYVQGFFQPAGNTAFWLVGTAGNVDATGFFGLAGSGWEQLTFTHNTEDSGTFFVHFRNFASKQYATYLFDNNGNWIAASSYQA